ncbi:MAG: hypothetical protein QOG28_6469, partial [Trebonia sp.]|nr:hypothetical protein [Trebonia sp.]
MPDASLMPDPRGAGERALPGFDRAELPAVTPLPFGIIQSLKADLEKELGREAVITDEAARLSASTDWAHMSPVLEPMLPGGVADVVVRPRDATGIAAAVGAAHRHRVPVTVRGQGTGNYGQAIPLYGGLVIDTSRASRIVSVGDGEITAEAGASFVMMEKA